MAEVVNIKQFASNIESNFNHDVQILLERVILLSDDTPESDILHIINEVSSVGYKLCAIDYIGSKLNIHDIQFSIFNRMYADYRCLLSKILYKLKSADLDLLPTFSKITNFANLKEKYDFLKDSEIEGK